MKTTINEMTAHPSSQVGFSLLEMSIVLIILALVSTSLFSSYASQKKLSQFHETQRQLETIKEALTGFAQVHGRLPCPAAPDLPENEIKSGVEDRIDANSPCSRNYGVVPWASLGLSGTDAWGRRYSYFVSAKFSAPSSSTGSSSFNLGTGSSTDSAGTANIKNSTIGGNSIASDLPAVIVSHGPNGLGAFTQNGIQIPGAQGDELENANNTQTFIARLPDGRFDDQLTWLVGAVLKSKMVSAGKLP